MNGKEELEHYNKLLFCSREKILQHTLFYHQRESDPGMEMISKNNVCKMGEILHSIPKILVGKIDSPTPNLHH